jgi:hypothetical protein
VKTILALALLFFALHAQAQTSNVTPQIETLFEQNVQVDIRLKGPATATNPFPTVRLLTMKFTPLNAKSFVFSVPCWNASSACPKVVGVTVQVFLQTPVGRANVTRFTGLCTSTTECVLPAFTAIQAKPGEIYRFNYSRINAAWNEPPLVMASTLPAPVVAAPTTTTSDATKMPPASVILDATGAQWTTLPQLNGRADQVGIARNGVRVSDSVDYLTIKGGVVYQFDAGCEQWTGTAWAAVGACP